ncbi:MAG: large subunit ribosomal protein [Frankiaceae bacterium]|nr:large subunit ribosomal protein [Frankiaceae bacterium]
MSEVRIAAEPRTEFGKGGARRTRRAGKVPAVLYGHGTDPVHISLPSRDFAHAIKGGGLNVLLTLDIAGGSQLALPKAIQRDPIRGSIDHVDLVLVRKGERVTVDVHVVLVGDIDRAAMLEHSAETISVEADATELPNSIEVNVDGLTAGATIHARDVKLPAGTTLAEDGDKVIVHVINTPSAAQMESEGAGTTTEAAAPVVDDEAPAEA